LASTAVEWHLQPAGKQGRPITRERVDGRAYLSHEEVEQLQTEGGSKALKEAFAWLYGKPTCSGNLKWLRAALRGAE